MRPLGAAWSGWLGIGMACAAGLAAGCASLPAPVVPVDRDQVRLRHDRALGSRESRGRMLTADVTLWLTLAKRGRLPGASGRMLLVAPEGFRLQLASAVGVALDVCARGDTLTGYAPGERLALDLVPASDSLGVGDPGRLLFRCWAASWRPAPGAWERAMRADSLTRVSWSEESDSIDVEIGTHGLPREVRVRLSSGRRMTARYLAWTFVGGVAWPASLEVEDDAGEFRLRGRVTRARFERDFAPERLRVELPASAERVTLASLVERFEAW